jgi:hypothetical protein
MRPSRSVRMHCLRQWAADSGPRNEMFGANSSVTSDPAVRWESEPTTPQERSAPAVARARGRGRSASRARRIDGPWRSGDGCRSSLDRETRRDSCYRSSAAGQGWRLQKWECRRASCRTATPGDHRGIQPQHLLDCFRDERLIGANRPHAARSARTRRKQLPKMPVVVSWPANSRLSTTVADCCGVPC